jgi:hypothetical protein
MVLITIIVCIILGFVGSAIAKEKNREPSEGFLYGFFLSVFGLIIIAILPTKEKTIIESEVRKHTSDEKFISENTSSNNNDSIGYVFILLIVSLIIGLFIYVSLNS